MKRTRINLLFSIAISLIVVFLAACSAKTGEVTDSAAKQKADQWHQLNENQIPIDFEPLTDMTLRTAEQRDLPRSQGTITRLQYVTPGDPTSSAAFMIHDLTQSEKVFIEEIGPAGQLITRVREFFGNELSETGAAGTDKGV